MLREIEPVHHNDQGLFRRWFEDDSFDLIVWYDARYERVGFQLCYQKGDNEHALTWHESNGYRHHRIDGGEQSVWGNKSPVLQPPVMAAERWIIDSFLQTCQYVEPEIVKFVIEKLEAYQGWKES